MPDSHAPLIALEAGGRAPVLHYQLPEPSSYTGRHFLPLDLSARVFARQAQDATPGPVRPGRPDPDLLDRIRAAMRGGFRDPELFPLAGSPSSLRTADGPDGVRLDAAMPLQARLRPLAAEEVAANLAAGQRLTFYRSLSGALGIRWLPLDIVFHRQPRLVLVETYRLSSFTGAYGAGRVVHTFTLLPGEKTRITVRTWQKSEEARKRASSILDSVTQESADEFETQVQTEQSDKLSFGQSSGFEVGAEADATWGSTPIRGRLGFKDDAQQAREEFSRNLSSATAKHAARASASREVRVESSVETSTESGTELSTERTIENINLSRTLNFVFRQMNQEFLSLLHLVDVRVGYALGFSRRLVPLHDLDDLLEDVIAPPHRVDVKTAIADALDGLVDYAGQPRPLVTRRKHAEAIGQFTFAVDRGLTSTFTDPVTGTAVAVPGVIRSADRHVLRTDGVIVDAILGQGEALDPYSTGLQTEAVREKALANDWRAATLARERLAQSIVEARDEVAARLFEQVYETPPDCGPGDAGRPERG